MKKLFLEIEDQGGYIKTFKAGIIQKIIEDTVQKRDLNIATKREIILREIVFVEAWG